MSTPFVDDSGEVRLSGLLTAPGATVGDVLTVQADGSLVPAPGGGGGLPTGWTQDDSDPANLDAHAGSLTFDDDSDNSATLYPYGVDLVTADAAIHLFPDQGVLSVPPEGSPAYAASSSGGGTVALDGDGLSVSNIADPADPQDADTQAAREAALSGALADYTATADLAAAVAPQIATALAAPLVTDLDVNGNILQDVGSFAPTNLPVIPALPTTQDVVNALIGLGLVTQAS